MPSGLDGNPDPIVTPQRTDVLEHAAGLVLNRRRDNKPFVVGIDGIDGSGKSTFAGEVALLLTGEGLNVIRATVDSFHQPQRIRWRKGKRSPAGFYFDSHDLDALRCLLLDPFQAGAGSTYRTAAFDEPTDQPVEAPVETVVGDEVLLFDGIFLGRPELADYWDLTIFLDGQARVNLGRLSHILADAPETGTDLVDHVLRWVERIDRYSSGMRLYLDTEDPQARADLVIDNNDLANPSVL
ncbi:MAG: uridine kinase [Actinomycetia bacterium]|nr:uridine kinase [Actinomycetes bacterium]MCP4225272.1 uridine kinase [Actinomycetes bacterium]MCP5031399.1 uridine kinase [Actinomycetes bacterium]